MSRRTYTALMDAMREHIEETTGRIGAIVTDFVLVTAAVDPAEEFEGRLYLTIASETSMHALRGLITIGDEHLADGMEIYDYGSGSTDDDEDDDEDEDADEG